MPSAPLFSAYRQGENRVTSSILAVLQRVGLDLTERIIAAASGESTLEMVSFRNQPSAVGQGVPDAEISARFKYLIEVKTSPRSVRREQLRRHLDRLEGTFGDERLLVITPDSQEPGAITELSDRRVQWIPFSDLADAIEGVLSDPDEPASEQQRFLLRELIRLFQADRLIGTDDTVVVAARHAYPEYLKTNAYICQPDRSFRKVTYFGFYTDKQIQPEIARIVHHAPRVLFTKQVAEGMAQSRDPHERMVAEVIKTSLAAGTRPEGEPYDVYVLSASTADDTVRLARAVRHTNGGAWTQGQRYTSAKALQRAETTDDL